MIEIMKKIKDSLTVFWNTASLLRKGLNTNYLPLISANKGSINLLNISDC